VKEVLICLLCKLIHKVTSQLVNIGGRECQCGQDIMYIYYLVADLIIQYTYSATIWVGGHFIVMTKCY